MWNVLARFRKVLSKNENVIMTVANFSQQVAAEVKPKSFSSWKPWNMT